MKTLLLPDLTCTYLKSRHARGCEYDGQGWLATLERTLLTQEYLSNVKEIKEVLLKLRSNHYRRDINSFIGKIWN